MALAYQLLSTLRSRAPRLLVEFPGIFLHLKEIPLFLSVNLKTHPLQGDDPVSPSFIMSSQIVNDTLVTVLTSNPVLDGLLSNARILSYPKQVLYLIASFIALISFCHFLSLFYNFITRNRVHDWRKRTAVSLTRVPAAVVDSIRTLAFRWTVPVGSSYEFNFAEAGLALAYMAVLFTWTFVNTTATTGVKVDPHYYADRAGTIAASQLPIMTALGMRNNLISWLTGVSYVKLNYLHRISARVLCVLVWIHAGGRITVGLTASDGDQISNTWIQCGIIAGSSLTLLCFLTVRPIRERNYEAFLFLHFVFAFIFMLAIYFHLAGQGLSYYGAWPSMIIWGLDRFIRIVYLATFNFAYLNPWSSKNRKKELDAVVEVLSSRFIRVTLHRSRHFHWRPGQNVYLSFPSVSTFPFESHPFTISTIDDNSTSGDSMLVFLLRVQSGFTQKLLKAASSDKKYKAFLNGPYGSPPLLVGYQTVILIAGGSGVTFTLPLFLDILRRGRAGKNACQKILFVWAIRNIDDIHWIASDLASALKNVPPSILVTVKLYITGTSTDIQKLDESLKESGSVMVIPDDRSSTSRSYSNIFQSPFVEFHQGRPNLKPLISKEIDEATGSISVNVCGTHSLANAARAAVRSPRPMDILRGGPTVSFHVESFGTS